MARIAYDVLRNSQVSLHWPPARRHHGWLSRTSALLWLWRERSHQRALLARLDERSLRDIGQSGADAWRESAKWFWQA